MHLFSEIFSRLMENFLVNVRAMLALVLFDRIVFTTLSYNIVEFLVVE